MSSIAPATEATNGAVPATRRPRPHMLPVHLLTAFAWFYAVCIVAGLAVLYHEQIRWQFVTPLIAIVAILAIFLLRLRRIEHTLPYFEIGAFYVSVASIYMLYPLTKYVLQGYRYDRGDIRMVMTADHPELFARMTWWYVLYLATFCLVYSWVRGRRRLQGRVNVKPPGWRMILSILILLLGARLFFVVLGIFFDLRVSSYMDTYLVIQRLPLVVRQIAAQVLGSDMTLQMMLVVALTCGKRRSFRILLVLFLLYQTIVQLLQPGGRINLFAVIIAALAARHLVVRKLRLRTVVVAAMLGFIALGVMAAVRSSETKTFDGIRERLADETEFEVIFGNAIDLSYIQHADGMLVDRPNLYWSGVLSLVPQQLLPLVKDNLGDWYVRTYYTEYFVAGGGLAFGVLAEGVTGYGWPEMIWRGALVGLAFALIHRMLYRPQLSAYLFCFSIWVTAWSYTTIRSGTFGVLTMFTYRFLMPAVAVLLLSMLLPRGHRFTRRIFPANGSDR